LQTVVKVTHSTKTLKNLDLVYPNLDVSGCKTQKLVQEALVLKRYLPLPKNHKSEHQDQRNKSSKKLQIILEKKEDKRKDCTNKPIPRPLIGTNNSKTSTGTKKLKLQKKHQLLQKEYGIIRSKRIFSKKRHRFHHQSGIQTNTKIKNKP